MTKADEYRIRLHELNDWEPFLRKESGLPGPRGNIELAQAVADEGNLQLFEKYITYTADRAPVNSPDEFLAFCGILGLGRLLAEGDESHWKVLRHNASDSRWRVREAVAMALQRYGDGNRERLISKMEDWSHGTWLEQRAAAASLCEPRLLSQAKHARAVLKLLDWVTASIEQTQNRRHEDFRTLRKGLGYCWSVATAALPDEGKSLMDKWLINPDKDIQWIMRENLKKARLSRMDAGWVKKWVATIERKNNDPKAKIPRCD
jgi:hypothetical protein